MELIDEYSNESRKEFRLDLTSNRESLMVPEQGYYGKKNIFKGILLYIREVNLKASGRGLENNSRKPNSTLGYISDHLVK